MAAVAGTAVAGPGASTSKITKKKVTKIADKEINKLAPGIANDEITKRAPGLSVAHANTATNANHANTATTAETAANADALNGVRIVGQGNIGNLGALGANSCSGDLTATVPGVQGTDHVVLTPPNDWETKNVTAVATVTSDTVHLTVCNKSAALANFGTAFNIKFLVFR